MDGKELNSIRSIIRIPLVVLLIFTQSPCSTYGQVSKNVFLPEGWVSYQAIFDSIEKRTNFFIHYPPTLDAKSLVYTKKGSYYYQEVLERYITPKKFSYRRVGRTIWIRAVKPAAFLTKVIIVNHRHQRVRNLNLQTLRGRHMYNTDATGTALIKKEKATRLLAFSTPYDNPDTLELPNGDSVVIELPFRDALDKAFVNGYATGTPRNNPGDRAVVNQAELAKAPVSNPLEALSGRMAGVLVTQTSGMSGAGLSLSIRGRNSILNGQDPLYIIDGVPYAPQNQSVSYITSGNAAGSLSAFSFISPDMIDKIEVLKDADATAIYGSRGANGVVLITTRQGEQGRCMLDVSLSQGVRRATRMAPLMNIQEYAAMRKEALRNDGLSMDTSTAPELVRWGTLNSTNWGKKLVGGAAPVTHLQLSVAGGSAKTRYLLNFSKLLERDVLTGHHLHDLNSFNSSVVHNSPDGKFHLQGSAIAGFDGNNQFITDITQYQLLAPNAPPLLDKQNKLVFSEAGQSMNNPLSYTEQPYHAQSMNLLLSANTAYELLPHLTFKTTLGFSNVGVKESSSIPMSSRDPSKDPTGSTYTAENSFMSWICEPQMEYGFKKKDWNINILGGATWQGQRTRISTASATGLLEDLPLGSLPAHNVVAAGDTLDYRYRASFGRVNLRLKERYILNLTARHDISSRFSEARRGGNFGAAGLAWIFSDEPFFRKRVGKVVSLGKLRSSYGVTGNDQIGGNNNYFTSWEPTAALSHPVQSSILTRGTLSPEVTWETVRKLELGLDLSFWQNQVLFSVSWYRNRSGNQLVPDSLPQSGTSMIVLKNQPIVIQNSGWEFTLSSHNIDHLQFGWTSSLNLSLPENKLVAYPGILSSPFGKDLMVGQSLSALRAYKYVGVDPLTGVYQFKYKRTDRMTDADRQMVGKLGATCFGGLENTFRWRQWQLSVFLEGRIQQGANYQAAIFVNNPPGSNALWPFTNETKALEDRWRKPGDKSVYQKLTTQSVDALTALNNWIASSALLTNASFLRLKTLTISYQLPASWLGRMRLKEGKLSLEGENIFTMTPYKDVDPEIQSIMVLPPMRTIQLSIRARF